MKHICPIYNELREATSTPYSRGDWSLVQCCDTGLVYLAEPPTYEELQNNFAWEKTSADERKRRAVAEPVFYKLSSISKRIRKRALPKRMKIARLVFKELKGVFAQRAASVLDVGCSSGGLMVNIIKYCAARNGRIKAMGIEISHHLASISRERFRQNDGDVVTDSALGGAKKLPPYSVDLMIMHSFLEHEAQPKILLENLRSVLRDHGSIVIKVPNYACWNRHIRGGKWCGFRYPDHVNYFTPETLALLANATGFTLVPQSIADRNPLSDNMYAVMKKN